MSADDAAWLEEQFPLLLTACDEALAAGKPAETLDLRSVPAEHLHQIHREIAWCRRVRQLWRKAGSAEPAVVKAAAGSEAPLTSLGRFQICHELGRGAFGVVFLAYDPLLTREVALKVPRAEVLVSAELRSRFQQEARAAAGLQHPNLVPVYDAGEEGSVCWIASAYCPGITLAAWLKQQTEAVPYSTAAQLVAAIAQGMEHAHQRGVLHRDLKPSNVLLEAPKSGLLASATALEDSVSTNHGLGFVPRVADFGLAKLVDGAAGASQAGYDTQSGAIVGTAGYMAPEQASGHTKSVGPAADIYALGVILYEMLTGRPPFQGDTPLDTLLLVRTQEPLSPVRLRPHLPRDLETICLKCLEKEPAKRYPSAGALADDLRRYLGGEPIQARPMPVWERSIKWARRRPAVAALLGVSGVASLAVLTVVLIAHHRLQQQFQEVQEQRRQALANFRKARDAVDRMTELARDRLPDVPQTETLRRDLLTDVVTFYQDFAQEKSNDPDVLCETGRAYRRLGEIFEGLFSDLPKAEQAYQKALETQERVVRDFPDLAMARRELAMDHMRLGVGQAATGRYPEALLRYQQALSLQERLLVENPDDRDYRGDLAITHNFMGITLARDSNRLREAENAYRRSIELMEQLAARFPTELRYRTHLALPRNNLATLLLGSGRLAKAEQAYRQNLELWEDLAARYPAVVDHRSKICLTLHNLAEIWAETNRTQEAEQALRRSWELRLQIVKDFPAVPFAYNRLADNLHPLAKLVARRGDVNEARQLFEAAISHRKTAGKLAPQD